MIIDKGDIAVSSIIDNAGPGEINLLEIGCGDGRITRGLQYKYKRLIAIDPDEESIHLAREKYPHIDFRIGSGESLDFLNEVFDVVLFSLSLHHQNGEKALQQVKSVLAPEGKVIVLEPAIDSHISQLCNLFEDESASLKQAIVNIQKSNFTILSSSKVSTEWVFRNKNELYNWLFDYYNQQPNPVKVNQVDAFLEEKEIEKENSITIIDTLVLTELAL